VPRPNRPAHKPKPKANECKGSACSCNFKAPVRASSPLNSNCVLVNSVVGSKTVQKVAETTLPLGVFLAALTLADIISINVVPNLSGITTNARIIRDKVVNIGLIPATFTISTTIVGSELLTFNTTIPFQEHTDFPGACPEDLLQETPLQVEGTFVQPGVPVLDVAGLTLVDGILVKIILRTTITVTRPILLDAEGNFCDVSDRCTTTGTPPVFILPAPPTGGGLLGGV
jgi:hypothetical protein